MDKFEYLTKTSGFLDVYVLNELGRQGWELVALDTSQINNYYFFKRKLSTKTVPDKKQTVEGFYAIELKKSQNNEQYRMLIEYLFGKNDLNKKYEKLLRLKDQIGWEQFQKLTKKCKENNISLQRKIDALQNGNYKMSSFYLTINNWVNKDIKK